MEEKQVTKSLNRFWGWLMFFYVGCWLALVINIAVAALLLVSLPKITMPLHIAEIWVYVLDTAVTLFLFVCILKTIRKPETATPNAMIRLISLVFLFMVLFFIPEFYLGFVQRASEAGEKHLAELAKGFFQALIWYAIWTAYFKKSQRVLAYYGKNADKAF